MIWNLKLQGVTGCDIWAQVGFQSVDSQYSYILKQTTLCREFYLSLDQDFGGPLIVPR